MNKELFVSSTPHETKVGLVEDDLLAEVYLERENEYTLAGSIYKGRVTRVLPGMQSAVVAIGLERDAFLYVSDFMELEEHDDDLTDVVPASRGVQDLRQQPASAEGVADNSQAMETAEGSENDLQPESEEEPLEAGEQSEVQPATSAGVAQEPSGDSQGRERGSWRGRRRRRGGRRDGRDRGSERSPDRGADRPSERSSERTSERSSDRVPAPHFARSAETQPPRTADSGRNQPSGPPPGYQPILLPGESISKYQRFLQQAPVQETQPLQATAIAAPNVAEESPAPLAATFPEDEPIFAAEEAVAEPLHEQHDDVAFAAEEPAESASTSTSWKREFRRPEEESVPVAAWTSEAKTPVVEEVPYESEEHAEPIAPAAERSEQPESAYREQETPVFAGPGTMEEETIEEEEADTIHYQTSSDEGDEEFEEETQAAGQPAHLNGDARETVSEIHMSSIVESGEAHPAEGAPAEEEESEAL